LDHRKIWEQPAGFAIFRYQADSGPNRCSGTLYSKRLTGQRYGPTGGLSETKQAFYQFGTAATHEAGQTENFAAPE
jgi:hypothetical protein